MRAPVGRTRLYDELVAHLHPDRPAVMAVVGAPGTGRSYLLEHLRGAAVELGYRFMGVDEQLVVDPTTTLTDVWRVVRALGQPEAAATDLARRPPSVADSDIEDAVLHELRTAAPILLAVEGYTPHPDLDEWITQHLIARLRSERIPVVLVIAGTEENVAAVRRIADVSVELGRLDVDEVSDFLAEAARDVRPPVDDEELRAYAGAAADHPSYVWAFADVFASLGEKGRGKA